MWTLNEYQEKTNATAIYPNRGKNLIYPVLGLCGEAGEVAEKVKKMIRDEDGVLTPERREAIVLELGDQLCYIAQAAFELGVSLDYVAVSNIEKLMSRKKRQTLQGSGDNR